MSAKITLDIRKVVDLKPFAANGKRHPDDQIAAICDSIRLFGFNDPIGITPDGVIVEGEGRWLALQKMGIEEAQVLVLEGLTERQIDTYRIAHNKLTLTTGFDVERVVEALREITGTGEITLEGLGFSDKSSRNVLASFGLTSHTADEETQRQQAVKYAFEIVWDTEEQKAKFDRLQQAAQSLYPEQDPATALLLFVESTGVMTQEIVNVEHALA